MQAPQGKLKEFDAGDAKKEFLCIPLLIAKWCKWRSDAVMQVMHVMQVMQAMHWQCSFQAELLQSADGTSCARPGFHNCLKLHTDKQTDTETDT